jgi:hypothetical protein
LLEKLQNSRMAIYKSHLEGAETVVAEATVHVSDIFVTRVPGSLKLD